MRLVLLGACLLLAAPLPAQNIRRSQQAEVRQRIGDTWVSVRYSRPVARGRTLFGTLVPWGEMWCPGADTATSIRINTAIEIDGQPLPAGGYSVWMIPDSTGPWTVIFSRTNPVWHTRYPGESRDQLRLRVAPQTGSHMETLAFYFPEVEGPEATLVFHWGTTMLPMRIRLRP